MILFNIAHVLNPPLHPLVPQRSSQRYFEGEAGLKPTKPSPLLGEGSRSGGEGKAVSTHTSAQFQSL